MNLRRIIREEVDDFDWIRDLNPLDIIATSFLNKVAVRRHNPYAYVKPWNYNIPYHVINRKNYGFRDGYERIKNMFFDYLDEGIISDIPLDMIQIIRKKMLTPKDKEYIWEKVVSEVLRKMDFDPNINESEQNDFDWVRDISNEKQNIIRSIQEYIKEHIPVADIEIDWERTRGGGEYFGKVWMYDRFYELYQYNDTFTVRFYESDDYGNYHQYDQYENLDQHRLKVILLNELLSYYNYRNTNLNESQEDDFDWIREIPTGISPEELNPGDRFRIISIKGRSLSSYMDDEDLTLVDPYSVVFKMDQSSNFQDENGIMRDEYFPDMTQIWLRSESDPDETRGWVDLSGLVVVKI